MLDTGYFIGVLLISIMSPYSETGDTISNCTTRTFHHVITKENFNSLYTEESKAVDCITTKIIADLCKMNRNKLISHLLLLHFLKVCPQTGHDRV